MLPVSLLACSSTLNMEAARLSETSMDLCQITLCYMPEDSSFHSHRYERLDSNKFFLCLLEIRRPQLPELHPVKPK
jgi:hypothetical protein